MHKGGPDLLYRAPWAEDSPAAIVLIVSAARSASTEMAEAIGNHPCGASFNELLVKPHFPVGYSKYVNGSLSDFLNVSRLRKHNWLGDARAVRARFCDSRPAAVAKVCGHTCPVSLKMHLNKYVVEAMDPDWLQLVTAEDVRAVVVEREGVDNYCSIAKAEATADWGHTPTAHKNVSFKCDADSRSAWHFVQSMARKFNATRSALAAANRPKLEIPFAQYAVDPSHAVALIYAFSGLRQPPKNWQGKCGLPWCRDSIWPPSSSSSS